MSVVLVTGGSGFIASYCILQLLAAGHQVRATVRSLKRESDVRAMLKQGGAEPGDRLKFFAAELEQDAGWREAVTGCDYVLHVASPLSQHVPKNEDEMIVPARDGTLRVLRAARDAGVKRVVLTSSSAAIGYGRGPPPARYDETALDGCRVAATCCRTPNQRLWPSARPGISLRNEGGGLELSVINPVLVLGPVLGRDYSPSIFLVKRLLEGRVPGCPRLYFGIVDVRDIADLHIRAMTDPAAKGERFLAVAGDFISVREIAAVLKTRLGPAAGARADPASARLAGARGGAVSSAARQILPELGKVKNGSGDKARRLLGWAPRSREDAIAATGESLVRLGLLKDSAKKAA